MCIFSDIFDVGIFVCRVIIHKKGCADNMHEVALISGVLDILRESAVQNDIKKIKQVKLVVGKFCMALPDSLLFAFNAMKQEELFMEAELEIEEKDTKCVCSDCNKVFLPADYYAYVCPNCAGYNTEIIAGRELYIDYYEGD